MTGLGAAEVAAKQDERPEKAATERHGGGQLDQNGKGVGRCVVVSQRIEEYDEYDRQARKCFLVLERTIRVSEGEGHTTSSDVGKSLLYRHLPPPFFDSEESKIAPMRHHDIDGAELKDSVNVFSVTILESDVPYPIKLYGTVLVRDELDRKCVYLFRRDRNDPQLIKSQGETLSLTGPSRGLVVSAHLFFEIDLKIKGDQLVDDKDFSKGIEHYDAVACPYRINRDELTSWLSTIELTYAHLQRAVEATVDIKIARVPDDGVVHPVIEKGVLSLKVPAHFYGKITACTSGIPNDMVLYDSEQSNTAIAVSDDEFVGLCRRVIAVPIGQMLLLKFVTWNGECKFISMVDAQKNDRRVNLTSRTFSFTPKVCGVGLADFRCPSYKMHVKVVWSALYICKFDPVL